MSEFLAVLILAAVYVGCMMVLIRIVRGSR